MFEDAEALVLIDARATAKEAGIRYPVALTRAVWERCVAVPPGVVCQDEAGRPKSTSPPASFVRGFCGRA
jgi:hypothetical protein